MKFPLIGQALFGCACACTVVSGAGCHPWPTAGVFPGSRPTGALPTARPAPVAVPTQPPAPPEEAPLFCDDGQVYVPGQWQYARRWDWQPGYCAPARPGYLYVRPVFDEGRYTAGYFAPPEPASAPLPGRVGPTYQRYLHPPGMIVAAPQPAPLPPPPLAEPEPQPQAPRYWGAPLYPYPAPWPLLPQDPGTDRQRPRQQPGGPLDPGTGERPAPGYVGHY